MAINNELRKILLREQDLRFVTDTLSEYLGKKDEERKYYAEEARRERLKKEELALKESKTPTYKDAWLDTGNINFENLPGVEPNEIAKALKENYNIKRIL